MKDQIAGVLAAMSGAALGDVDVAEAAARSENHMILEAATLKEVRRQRAAAEKRQ